MRLLAVILVAAVLPVCADIIVTRSVIHTGEIVHVTADNVEIKVAVAEITIPKSDVLKLDQGDPAKANDALDSYLKVVALFDLDTERAAEAKYKAAKIFEQAGHRKRAKESYSELIKESPAFAQADDAKQHLADLTRAHPE
jgi:hypothetical protein